MYINSYYKKISLFILIALIMFFCLAESLITQTIYVDALNGNDKNPGTKEKPVKSLSAASNIINLLNTAETRKVILSPGVYLLSEKALFNYSDTNNKGQRLIIDALTLPDDSAWMPDLMPVILSTAAPSLNFGFDCTVGIDIEVSRATIRGLKFLGNPIPNSYYYPIGRQGKNLEDLNITQCVFIGDKDALPIQSGILAHGNSIIVDHCVFYNCKNSVVFYFADADREKQRKASGMNHCIVYGGYESGIWTASPDENFIFHHNIITHCENTWIHNLKNRTCYEISNSILTNNRQYVTCVSPAFEFTKSDIAYHENNVNKQYDIQLVMKNDIEMPVDYLHVVSGTPGSNIGAGLFIKKDTD